MPKSQSQGQSQTQTREPLNEISCGHNSRCGAFQRNRKNPRHNKTQHLLRAPIKARTQKLQNPAAGQTTTATGTNNRSRWETMVKAKAENATCPNCGKLCKRPEDLIKEWNATPKAKAGQIQVWIHYWQCPACGKRFRTATRIWPKS